MDSVASRYADSLLSLAKEKKLNTEYRNQIKDIYNTFNENEDIKLVLKSAFITKNEKIDVLNKILVGVDEIVKNFILVIVENNRQDSLFDILKEFIKVSNLEDGICEGFVYSVQRLSKDEINKISLAIEKKINKKIALTNRLDDSLIGGVKVIVDDYVFDASIKNKLNELKNHLQEGAK